MSCAKSTERVAEDDRPEMEESPDGMDIARKKEFSRGPKRPPSPLPSDPASSVPTEIIIFHSNHDDQQDENWRSHRSLASSVTASEAGGRRRRKIWNPPDTIVAVGEIESTDESFGRIRAEAYDEARRRKRRSSYMKRMENKVGRRASCEGNQIQDAVDQVAKAEAENPSSSDVPTDTEAHVERTPSRSEGARSDGIQPRAVSPFGFQGCDNSLSEVRPERTRRRRSSASLHHTRHNGVHSENDAQEPEPLPEKVDNETATVEASRHRRRRSSASLVQRLNAFFVEEDDPCSEHRDQPQTNTRDETTELGEESAGPGRARRRRSSASLYQRLNNFFGDEDDSVSQHRNDAIPTDKMDRKPRHRRGKSSGSLDQQPNFGLFFEDDDCPKQPSSGQPSVSADNTEGAGRARRRRSSASLYQRINKGLFGEEDGDSSHHPDEASSNQPKDTNRNEGNSVRQRRRRSSGSQQKQPNLGLFFDDEDSLDQQISSPPVDPTKAECGSGPGRAHRRRSSSSLYQRINRGLFGEEDDSDWQPRNGNASGQPRDTDLSCRRRSCSLDRASNSRGLLREADTSEQRPIRKANESSHQLKDDVKSRGRASQRHRRRSSSSRDQQPNFGFFFDDDTYPNQPPASSANDTSKVENVSSKSSDRARRRRSSASLQRRNNETQQKEKRSSNAHIEVSVTSCRHRRSRSSGSLQKQPDFSIFFDDESEQQSVNEPRAESCRLDGRSVRPRRRSSASLYKQQNKGLLDDDRNDMDRRELETGKSASKPDNITEVHGRRHRRRRSSGSLQKQRSKTKEKSGIGPPCETISIEVRPCSTKSSSSVSSQLYDGEEVGFHGQGATERPLSKATDTGRATGRSRRRRLSNDKLNESSTDGQLRVHPPSGVEIYEKQECAKESPSSRKLNLSGDDINGVLQAAESFPRKQSNTRETANNPTRGGTRPESMAKTPRRQKKTSQKYLNDCSQPFLCRENPTGKDNVVGNITNHSTHRRPSKSSDADDTGRNSRKMMQKNRKALESGQMKRLAEDTPAGLLTDGRNKDWTNRGITAIASQKSRDQRAQDFFCNDGEDLFAVCSDGHHRTDSRTLIDRRTLVCSTRDASNEIGADGRRRKSSMTSPTQMSQWSFTDELKLNDESDLSSSSSSDSSYKDLFALAGINDGQTRSSSGINGIRRKSLSSVPTEPVHHRDEALCCRCHEELYPSNSLQDVLSPFGSTAVHNHSYDNRQKRRASHSDAFTKQIRQDHEDIPTSRRKKKGTLSRNVGKLRDILYGKCNNSRTRMKNDSYYRV